VERRGHSTSIVDRPYDNDYCWIIRVVEEWIVEARAYFGAALVEDFFRRTER
jgi:ketosteroid isomerase-like protein